MQQAQHLRTNERAKTMFIQTNRWDDIITIYSLISCTFLPGIWPVFCQRLICATYPEGQSFRMSYHRISVIQSNCKCHLAMGESRALSCLCQISMTSTTIYRTYRQTSFFRWRRFLRFWTIKLTFITFACKNQYFVVDSSGRVFTSEKVNWPAACSWITLDSRYMAKISAVAYLRMWLISEYIWNSRTILEYYSCMYVLISGT